MIIVTGASRGIGRAIAERLAESGHEVLGIARTTVEANFEVVALDISDERMVKDFARGLRRRNLRIGGLVNAAGIASMNLAVMATGESMRRVIDTNLLGTIYMCQSVAPNIVKSGRGFIVNFSTIAVSMGLAGESGYVASKAGVEAFSRVLARELSPFGIAVNTIAPGPIATDLIRGVSEGQIRDIISSQIIRRQFEVSDVCDVVELLVDDRSRSLTGHVLHIGGV